jgi:hypothetical protein
MNVDSWWADQKPYVNSNINAIMTHSQAPDVFPTCPTAETTFENNDFDISEDIYFSAFLRDQVANTPINFKVKRPNGSYLYDWSVNATVTSSSWYYYYFFPVDSVGTWAWEVTYEGQTESHAFNVTDALSISDQGFNQTSIYPNPFNDVIHISSAKKVVRTHIVDILGKSVLNIEDTFNGISKINVSKFSNGLYFVILESDSNEIKTIKLIKE